MAKILLVDDSPTVLFKVGRDLRELGYGVVTASCLEEAVVELRAGGIDLVLLDLEMRPLSGIDIGRRLLEVSPELGIIIHSSKPTQSLAEAAGMLRAVGIVRKGSAPDRLRAVVDRSLTLGWTNRADRSDTETKKESLAGAVPRGG